jgi:hypothetical protein
MGKKLIRPTRCLESAYGVLASTLFLSLCFSEDNPSTQRIRQGEFTAVDIFIFVFLFGAALCSLLSAIFIGDPDFANQEGLGDWY